MDAVVSLLKELFEWLKLILGVNATRAWTLNAKSSLAKPPTVSQEINVPASWAGDWTIYVELSEATLFKQGALDKLVDVFLKVEVGHDGGYTNHNKTSFVYDGVDYSDPGGTLEYKRFIRMKQSGEAIGVSGRSVKVTAIFLTNTPNSVPDGTSLQLILAISKGRPKTRKITTTLEILGGGVSQYATIPNYCTSFTFEILDNGTGSVVDLNNMLAIEQIDYAGIIIKGLYSSLFPYNQITLASDSRSVDSSGNVVLAGQRTLPININHNAAQLRFRATSTCNVEIVYEVFE